MGFVHILNNFFRVHIILYMYQILYAYKTPFLHVKGVLNEDTYTTILHVYKRCSTYLQGSLRAPWDYPRITVRLPLTIARCPSDFPLIMAFKIVRKPSGYPPVPLRAFYRLSMSCLQSYGLMKTPGNWEQLAQHNGARTTCKQSPVALENRRAPYGHCTEMAKITVFTRHTGPLMDM